LHKVYSVATHLRCSEIFSDGIIANFLLILAVNNFENWLMFDDVTAYKKLCGIFWAYPVCRKTFTIRVCVMHLRHDDILSSSAEVEQSGLVLLRLHVSEARVCAAFHQSKVVRTFKIT